MIELAVTFEPQITESHEYKMTKYEDFCSHIHTHRYEAQLYAVEVGSRGLPTQSLLALTGRLGLGPKIRNCNVHAMCEAAETTSMWIWWRKDDHVWKQHEL